MHTLEINDFLCSNCAFYKQEYFDMGNFLIPDECIHPDNIKEVYRYNGRTQVRIWDPSEKKFRYEMQFI